MNIDLLEPGAPNLFGAGSPFTPDGVNNPFSPYGSPCSNQSTTNPFATDVPRLLVRLSGLSGFFGFPISQSNERDKPNKPDKPVLVSANKIDQIDQADQFTASRPSRSSPSSRLYPIDRFRLSLRPRSANRGAIAASAEKVPGIFSRVWTLGGANFMEPAGCRKRFVTVC